MKTKTKLYARASLLDRLIDLAPKSLQEYPPLRTQSRQAFMASLRRDLGWLLNTRSPLPQSELAHRQRSVIDYGIVDFSTFFTHNPDDYRGLKQLLEEAITCYEPRLQAPRVTITPLPGNHQELAISIEALLMIDEIKEPVSFPMIIRAHSSGEITFSHDD